MAHTISAEVTPSDDELEDTGYLGGSIKVTGTNLSEELVLLMAAHALAMEYGLDIEEATSLLDTESAVVDCDWSYVSYEREA
jgi:hypothetical protein